MGKLTPEQIAAIQRLAEADAERDWQRLASAGYSQDQIAAMMQEMAEERALQSLVAHGSGILQKPVQVEEAPKKPLWKFW